MLLEAVALLAAAQVQQADRAALIAQANAARAAHDFGRAIAVLEQARAAYPDDAEILRLLGTSYAFDGNYAAAIATLGRARDLAPDDLDIRAALARAYFWSGRRAEADAELAVIDARDPANADAAALRQQMAAPEPAATLRRSGAALWQGVAGVSLDSGADRTWWTTGASAYAALGRGTTVSAEIEREARGPAVDTHLLARVDQELSPGLRGFVAVSATPNADFREKWSLRGGIEADVASGLTLLADIRHADYGSAAVTAFEPGARLALAPIRGSVTLRMINLWDERDTHRTGWSGRIDGELGGGTAIFAGAATYPDTEAGITRRVRAVFAGAAVPISEAVTLRLTGDYERRADSYRKTGAVLGLQFRF